MQAIDFCEILKNLGYLDFSGVPDSCLKYFCDDLDRTPDVNHEITANEGAAVGFAIGTYLSTGRTPAVYMQNSGLCNSLNPIFSLVSKDVFNIPMLLIVGWRGDHENNSDEPQHRKQGAVSEQLLRLAGFDVLVLDVAVKAHEFATIFTRKSRDSSRIAVLVKPKALVKSVTERTAPTKGWLTSSALTRESVLRSIINKSRPEDLVICTTGKASREVYEIRREQIAPSAVVSDLLVVGGMGHGSAIALGVATRTSKRVILIDGDGALLMHMGTMATIGRQRLDNFIHILVNNFCHESVGGQPTGSESIEFVSLATALGYKKGLSVSSVDTLKRSLDELFLLSEGPVFMEVRVEAGSRDDLSRPLHTPAQNATAFARKVQNCES